MLDRFMEQLKEEFELKSPLSTEVPGVYAVPLEEDVAVTISKVPNGIALTCSLIECPKERQEEFFTEAMKGNLFGQTTGGATLGLDGEGTKLILSHQIEDSIDYNEFMDVLEDFINAVDYWREEVIGYLGTKKVTG